MILYMGKKCLFPFRLIVDNPKTIMISKKIYSSTALLVNQNLSMFRRHFRSHLSPIKPGVLMVRSQTDMKIQAAALTSDQTMCEAKVNLTTDSSTALDKLSSQLRVELYDRNTFNEVIVEVPDELAEHSHCLNISIPQHYCK